MRYLDLSKLRQKVEWQLPRVGGKREVGSYCLMGIDFQFYG